MSEIYLGALSGTSLDSIDVVAAEITDQGFQPLCFSSTPITSTLADKARKIQTAPHTLMEFGQLDSLFSDAFSEGVLKLLQHDLARKDIKALGLHGQTLLHHPYGPHPFTLQIGNPDAVAAKTGLMTVSDFRRRDIAYGGQGAPLAPCFHAFAFGASAKARAIVNIGGISNISFLSNNGEVTSGFDSGPGNCLMDAWIRQHKNLPFDDNGAWARSQAPDPALLQRFLEDPYFSAPCPKSACTSVFNLAWIEKHLLDDLPPAVVQSTLAELSAHCIADSLANNPLAIQQLLVCGGGAYNANLMERIAQKSGIVTTSTATEGVDPLQVEALCFAWMARCRIHQQKISTGVITGAKQPILLGNIYHP